MKRLAITTGDADGIGFEIADKALAKVGPKAGHQYLLWRHSKSKQKFSRAVRQKFKIFTVKTLEQALQQPSKSKTLIEISSDLPPAEWVRQSAQAALKREIHGLCTGPLSKTSPGAGSGHTGIFRELVKQPLYMFFLGSKFHVVLLTDHIAVDQIKYNLTPERIEAGLQLTQQFITKAFKAQSRLPLGVLGLNPHAGEHGLLGQEEKTVLSPCLAKLSKHVKVEGPLVPDAAFLPQNWKKYAAYVAAYHDQGLIPFKMAHGHDSGVHLTLGLPFVRTSVDHGTAKDLFGKNKAKPGSMIDALRWAIKLTAAGKAK